MAHLRALIALVMALVCCSPHAQTPPITTEYRSTNGQWYSSMAAACAATAPWFASSFPSLGWLGPPYHTTGLNCVRNANNGAKPGTQLTSRVVPGYCVNDTELVNGFCVCKAGFVQGEGQCVPDAERGRKWKEWCRDVGGKDLGFYEAKGRGATGGCFSGIGLAGQDVVPTPGYSMGDVPADGGCTVGLTNTRSFPNPDGTYYTQGDAVFTGGVCKEGDVLPTDPEGTEEGEKVKRSDCIGGYQGEMQGLSFCAKPDPTSGVDWNGTSKSKGVDGTETTKETKTTCIGDTCKTETKTTTKDAAGNTTGTNTHTVTENKGSLCAREPGNGICPSSGAGTGPTGGTSGGGGGGGGGSGQGGESGFSGNCESGFVAISDDAVINALARETHVQNCKVNPKADETTLAAEERVKTGNQTTENPNNGEVSIAPTSINSTDALGAGGGQCIPDITVSVWAGSSVVLPVSKYCNAFPYLGTLLVAIAFLVAGVIILRG